MDKGKFTDEARHIQQLISTKRDVCLPARRYLVNELSLRQKNYMPLTDWKPKCGARKLNYRVADTTLTECRLISDTRIVLRGILKFFFKLFEEDKATTQNIDIHNFLVAPQTLKIVTVDVTFVDYSPSARSTSIVQLTKIIKKFVGENDLPKDVIHLLDYLQTHESPHSREEVVLLHPCTYANCTLAAFLTYIHSLYSCAVKKRNQAVLYNFRAIARHMTRPTLPRILVDPSSNLWKSRYDDTANRNMHNPDFGGPLGVMIFMRHGLVHEDVKQEKAKNPRTLDAVENDLYVFFPTYVPNFVRVLDVVDWEVHDKCSLKQRVLDVVDWEVHDKCSLKQRFVNHDNLKKTDCLGTESSFADEFFISVVVTNMHSSTSHLIILQI